TTEKKVAKAWNDFGGLITALSHIVGIDPGCAVAVICVESSGKGFSADKRMIIRFENHKFWKFWGKQHLNQFNEHFKYQKGKAWLGHEFRSSANADWNNFHGKQSREWDVFNFAKGLDEPAAMQSISMGLPQIMGFNHAAIGYESPGKMFSRFQFDIRYHILGLFDFLRGAGTTSPMLQALQRSQYDQFASHYNGSGQAAKYATLIENHFETFKNLA
ncbi:MAG: N-acetylmuramidase domain-containing protein, partial [Mariprofundus sp.]|nr:N-acetylmuramidase domain-containing protein [Mariprofundus sp.]